MQDNQQAGRVHPLFASILEQSAQLPVQVRRADYVSRLARLGYWSEVGDAGCDQMGRDEEQRLRLIRAEIDPDGELWNKHAPLRFRDSHEVHTFKDFVGACPATVEWVLYPQGAKVIAVVIETVQGPKSAHSELSIGALARYQLQAEKLAASMATKQAEVPA